MPGDSLALHRDRGTSRHVVQFYEADPVLVDAAARFVAEGLTAGDAAVALVTAGHERLLTERLGAQGVDLAAAAAEGRYVTLPAADTLARLMADDEPDAARFTAVVAETLERASAGGRRRVRVFGELMAVLWHRGFTGAALRLEALWNDLARTLPVSILCAYPIAAFGSSDGAAFLGVCGAHAQLVLAESYATLTTDAERTRAIAQLQQKAAALECERAARRRAEKDQKELDDLFENAPIAIQCVGPGGRIVRANAADAALLGYALDEYVGRHVAELHVDRDGIEDMLARLRRGETLAAREARLRCKDGSIKQVLIDANGFWRDGALVHSRCFVRDVTDQRRREAAGAELAAIVECSDDAIVGKTLDGIVTSWNRGAEELFGWKAAEMIGQPISRIIPPDRQQDFTAILNAVRRGERVDHFETERVARDGHRVHVSLSVSPIRDDGGRIVGAAKIARDVTGRKRAEEERAELLQVAQRARAEAEAANAAKDEFLAMLGHELRTPLSAVRTAIVSAQLDDTRRERALGIARRQTEQLSRLVEDLLDVARITKGRISLRKEQLQLTEVIERAVETTRTLIHERGHALTVSLPPDDLRVEGDVARLEQVLVNLLNNAAKYTPPGGRIQLVAERRDGEAVVRVRDDGIGIAADILPRVFELFTQGERGLDRAQGGLGIGLTVVRSLVELHGGRVEAHSPGVGQGSEFVVILPALPTAITANPGPGRVRPLVSAVRRRVLLVEDNVDAAESLVMLLELLGHDVRVVYDGPSALDAMADRMPDVMLVDIGLPGMDGYEVARRVRARSGSAGPLLIALTGYGRDDHRRGARAAGFDAHLVKPVDPKTLQQRITDLPKRARRAGPRERPH